jgi:HEAT repeat protein
VPRHFQLLLAVTAVLLASTGLDAQADDSLTDAFEQARSYEFGESRLALTTIEQRVFTALDDPEQARRLEKALVELLNGDSTDACRSFACRQLALVGGRMAAEALGPMLLDAELCHMATYALERIPHPEATAVLLRALPNVHDEQLIEVIDAIGARRASDAIDDLEEFAASGQDDAARAAIAAIARIGTPRAGELLLVRLNEADDRAENAALFDAIVRCAEHLALAGHDELAGRLHAAVLNADAPTVFKMAAARGVLTSGRDGAASLIVDLIAEADEEWRGFALSLVRDAVGSELTGAVAAAIGQGPATLRVALIQALGERGDAAAMPALLEQLDDADDAVVAASIDALARLGDATVVAPLLAIVTSDQAIAQPAFDALCALRPQSVDAELVYIVSTTPDDDVRASCIEALGVRRFRSAAPLIADYAGSESVAVRTAVFEAMMSIGDAGHLGPLVEALLVAETDDELDLASRAILATAQRSDDLEARTAPIVTALRTDRDDVRFRILDALSRLGGERAFMAVAAQLEQEASRAAAIRALARWVDDRPTRLLGEIAASETNDEQRSTALAGFIRMAGRSADNNAVRAVERLDKAMTIARTDEERLAVVHALARVSDPAAIRKILELLDDRRLGRAAGHAALDVAANLPAEHHRIATQAAYHVLERRTEPALRSAAMKTIDSVERLQDYILIWQVAGPYRAPNVDGTAVLDHEFAPETTRDAPTVIWRDIYGSDPKSPGHIDLTSLENPSNCAAYARTRIWSDRRQAVRLEMGSDDGLKAWLNGEVIHENNVPRGVTLGEDVVTATFERGWNHLMLKIAQGAGGWGYACRLRQPSGLPLEDVRVDLHTPDRRPPADAIVLFGGENTDLWQHRDGSALKWPVRNGVMTVKPGSGNALSRVELKDFTLHLEFRFPEDVDSSITGQARSNSGVYIFGSYEVQLLDSWGDPPLINGCGAIYKTRPPNVNACRRPGQWQTYDIDFIAPRWNADGEKLSDARISVRHNGVLIHDDVRIPSKTGLGLPERPGPGPIVLQDHGNPVQFRNVWIVPHVAWEAPDAAVFRPLVVDDSLTGWTRRGGDAVYELVDGVIIGETRPNQPNTFLCTDELFDDFILQLEFKVHNELNSGVQIRSNSYEQYRNYRVHGYQVEIDPSDRAWSAGIYDEARRGWLHNLQNNEQAQAAFRKDDWNRLRIEARGSTFRTYLNDVPAALLIDGLTREGFIGLQVHGVGGRTDPLTVRWRNIRLRDLTPEE